MKFDYGSDYYENMLHMYSGSAKNIFKVRWDFVADANAQTVLDYGCGCNFLTIFQPHGVDVDSYDIGYIDEGVTYPQTGITRNCYDLVCFFDVLEHVDWENDPDRSIEDAIKKADWIAVSLPILPNGKPLVTWKHNKPGEHLTYFTTESLAEFFTQRGFKKVKSGSPECPPRIDILSVLYAQEDIDIRGENALEI